jgi:hypothetical protein
MAAGHCSAVIWSIGEHAMRRLFLRLLKNEDGFTAVECGILGCLAVIFAEKLALNI